MTRRLEPEDTPRRSLRGAWWIAASVAAFFGLTAVWQLREVVDRDRTSSVGDGTNVASYGFDLANLSVPRPFLVASGMPRDGLDPLILPRLMNAAEVDSLNGAERGKYLVAADLVIGVAAHGNARAYPVRVMNWHEVANDTMGGVPLAVTWHPLSGATTVLDRRHGAEVLELRLSGLLFDSHHLLYDRRPQDTDPSLWVPLLARAVAGPARGDTLTRLPHVLTRWGAWRSDHPGTTVLWPDPARRQKYKRDPYGNYASGDVLRFPVASLPPVPTGRRLKDLVAVRGDREGRLSAVFVHPQSDPAAPALAHAYWFAWAAILEGDVGVGFER